MASSFAAIFTVVVPLLVFGFTADITEGSYMGWWSFEHFNSSIWDTGDPLMTQVYQKPSDLDPKLEALDSNYSMNVWGSPVNQTSSQIWYSTYASEVPFRCYEITFYMKYYFENRSNGSTLMLFPVNASDEGRYHLPSSSLGQWTEVFLTLDSEILHYPWDEDISIFVDLMEDDIILFDIISLSSDDDFPKKLPFSCDKMPDGVYRGSGDPRSYIKCNKGHGTKHHCPKHFVFSPKKKACRPVSDTA